MSNVAFVFSETVDHAEACAAVALVLNDALDGAPIPQDRFALACREVKADPVVVLSMLVQAGVLRTDKGKIYLGPVGAAFVTCLYVTA